MTQVTVHQAKTHLSKLINKALDGEEVVIARRHKPMVRLTALARPRSSRRIGGLKHWTKRKGGEFDAPKMNRAIERDFNQNDQEDPLVGKGAGSFWIPNALL